MNYQEALQNGTMAKNYERFDEALDWFAKAIELDSTQSQAYFYRANIYNHSLKEYAKALEDYDKAMFFADQLPSFAFCKEHILGRANILTGRALSEYLQSNIRLFGSALLECLEYFDCEKILTAEEKLPYTTESAKESIGLIQKILDCSR